MLLRENDSFDSMKKRPKLLMLEILETTNAQPTHVWK